MLLFETGTDGHIVKKYVAAAEFWKDEGLTVTSVISAGSSI
jgi:hypothetical protein